jgi:hypothetical protein
MVSNIVGHMVSPKFFGVTSKSGFIIGASDFLIGHFKVFPLADDVDTSIMLSNDLPQRQEKVASIFCFAKITTLLTVSCSVLLGAMRLQTLKHF